MNLRNESAEIYVPDGSEVADALSRTTHLCIAAHQDDIEILAYHGIAECFEKAERHFTGVVVTDGAGSPRTGKYANYSDEQMREVRKAEQKKAAEIGKYSAVLLLDHPSSAVKDSTNSHVLDDFRALIEATTPQIIYTHNLADKHDTHVAVALRTISAIRRIPADRRPQAVYGCETWRGLDWLNDEDKIVLDVSFNPELAEQLIAVFDSQIAGGKRYDVATMGRRRANATFFESHGTDVSTALSFAMDLTPLVVNEELDPAEYVAGYIKLFQKNVESRILSMSKHSE